MLTKEQIKHIANLARLELTSQEEDLYQEQLSAVLDYVDKLAKVKTDEISSLNKSELVNIWREDRVVFWDQSEIDLALSQSDTESKKIKVKRVLN